MKKLILITDFTDNKIENDSSILLSKDRQKRAQLLKSEEEKKRFLCAEKITIDALSRLFSIENPEIYGDVGCKPVLKNNKNISFSRSYAQDILGLAIDDIGSVGIDCESIKKADDSVIKYFFTRKEKEYVDKSFDRDFAFSLIWTRKESFMKCTGKGLKYGFDLLDTTPEQTVKSEQKLFDENDVIDGYYVNSYRIGNTVISVCSEVNDEFPLFIQMR